MELIKKHIVTIAIVLIPLIGNQAWNLIQKGGEAEINNTIDARFTELMMEPIIVRMFLEQPDVKNFAKEQRQEAKMEAIEEDEGSVNFETRVAKEMGVFTDIAPKEIGKMYKEWESFKVQVRNKHQLVKM